MFGPIPSLFVDGVLVGEWPKETTKYYMQWYGLPAMVSGGSVYRWDKEWIECKEKEDVEYIDAFHCSEATPFIAEKEKIADGYYTLVGLTTDNPYGFRHPMLIPFDFFEVAYDRELTIDNVRNFLMFQPNVFGLFAYNDGHWANVDGYEAGLKFRYEGGHPEVVPEVRQANNGAKEDVKEDNG